MERPTAVSSSDLETGAGWRAAAGFDAASPNDQARLDAALMQRDALMVLLVAQSQRLVQRLALLAGVEKAAVAGLVTVGQTLVAYARTLHPDPDVMASFSELLGSLSSEPVTRVVDRFLVKTGAQESVTDAGVAGAGLPVGDELALRARAALECAIAETSSFSGDLKELLATLGESANGLLGRAGVRVPSRPKDESGT